MSSTCYLDSPTQPKTNSSLVSKSYVDTSINGVKTKYIDIPLTSFTKKYGGELQGYSRARMNTYEYRASTGSTLYGSTILSVQTISSTLTTTPSDEWYRNLMIDAKVYNDNSNNKVITLNILKMYDSNDDHSWYTSNLKVRVTYL